MIISYIWEFFIDLIECLLFGHLIKSHLTYKKIVSQPDTFLLLSTFFLSICIFIMNILNWKTEYVLLCSFILEMFITKLLFYGKNLEIIFLNILYIALTMFSEEINILFLSKIFHTNFSNIMFGGIIRYPITLMYIVCLAFLIFLSCHITNNGLFLNTSEKILFFLLSFLYLTVGEFVLTTVIQMQFLNIPADIQTKSSIFCMFFLFAYIVMLIFIYQLGISRHKNMEYALLQKMRELEKKEYENIRQTNKELRIVKHDLQFHIQTINQLLISEKYNELRKYIEQFEQTLQITHQLINSGNVVVDAVFTTYAHKASSQGTRTDFIIHLPDSLPLSDVELCSLFSNICSNALEACRKTTDPTVFRCIIKPYQNTLVIHAENSCTGDYHLKNGSIYSSKPSPKEHGIGLKRIKNITESVGGYTNITLHQKLFQIDIVIPLKIE